MRIAVGESERFQRTDDDAFVKKFFGDAQRFRFVLPQGHDEIRVGRHVRDIRARGSDP